MRTCRTRRAVPGFVLVSGWLVAGLWGVPAEGTGPGAEAPVAATGGEEKSPEANVVSAEAAAATGDAEAVLFALHGAESFPAALENRALGALSRGAAAALEAGDPILGLQLCQMALRHQATHREALIRCIQASEALDQYDPAEAWAATLREAHPNDVEGALLEARLYLAQGAWERARDAAHAAEALEAASAQEVARAQAYRARAEAELASRESALSEVEALTRQIEANRQARAERAEATPTRRPRARSRRESAAAEATASANHAVILYGTSWCGACRQAARWLRSQNVPFVEKDIERDQAALMELAAKAQARGIQPRGVPVIDVAGELLLGFSEQSLRQALTRKGLL